MVTLERGLTLLVLLCHVQLGRRDVTNVKRVSILQQKLLDDSMRENKQDNAFRTLVLCLSYLSTHKINLVIQRAGMASHLHPRAMGLGHLFPLRISKLFAQLSGLTVLL